MLYSVILQLSQLISYFIILQGFTFPVTELFLEDIIEKTRYKITPEFDNYQGNSRRRRQPSAKSDPLSEMFEVNAFCEVLCLTVLFFEQRKFIPGH